MNPYDDGIGLGEYVDWLVDAGHPIQRIPGYNAWLHNYQRPETPIRGSMAPTDRFRAAVQDAKIGPDKDIPHVTAAMIIKYITDL